MNTVVLAADENSIAHAAEIIRAGGLVAFPTETVYGLGANALNGEAVTSIFVAKGRPQDNPLIIHIADAADMDKYCTCITDACRKLTAEFWPGPLTVVLPSKPVIPSVVTCGLTTVAVRCPSHPTAHALIARAGVPIAAPSANLSGRPSTTTAGHVKDDLDGKIPLILDGGPCSIGVESTVVSMAADRPVLLRPGGISLEQLRLVVGEVDVSPAVYQKMPDSFRAQAPGMKYRHYAPKAELVIVSGSDGAVIDYIRNAAMPNDGVMCFDGEEQLFPDTIAISMGCADDPMSLSQSLFSVLRRFDDTGVDRIFARDFSCAGKYLGVHNRLMKAAGFHVVSV